jgi:serine/threonine protein kinase
MRTSLVRQLEAVVRDSNGRHLARCLVRRGRYVIGQDRKNEIVVDEPSVSSKHARLTVIHENEFLIEDLESANGTVVDGKRVNGHTPVTLESKVELGGATLEFQRGGLPASIFAALPPSFFRERRYEIGAVVVEGRTSTIHAARDTSLHRDIALKRLKPDYQANGAQVLRFIHEAQLTSQLQHPGVLPIYDLGLNEEMELFCTTRFVEGESLGSNHDRIAVGDHETITPAPLSLPVLLNIFQKACDTVAFAHSRGIVHCALRPECIMVGNFGEVFVTNWGFARQTADEPTVPSNDLPARAAASVRTPPITAFSAPEQTPTWPGELTCQTDVFALGAILYRILTLQPPVSGDSEEEILTQMMDSAISPAHLASRETLSHLPGGRIPEALSAIAFKAMAPRPAERFANISKMQRLVTAWQAGVPGERNGSIWKQVGGLLSLR